MAAVPGVTGYECTLTVGAASETMWITSADPTASKASNRTPTWGGNQMIHRSAGEWSVGIAGLFNPETGLNTLLEDALDAETPVTLVVNYGGYSRTYTDWIVTDYADSAPADGPVTFTATLAGAEQWESIPATPPGP